MYLDSVPFPVYCNACWYSDKWDALSFGAEYDFSKNFFVQFRALQNVTPRPALIGMNNVQSPYVNYSHGMKRSYFMVGCGDDEDCGYAYRTFNSRDSYDAFGLVDGEYCYENIQVIKSFRTAFADICEQLSNCMFMYDCKNCSDCIGCVGLRNKTNHIFNQPYSKEEYEKVRAELALGTHEGLKAALAEFQKLLVNFPRRFAKIILSQNSSGNNLQETKNCTECYFIRESQDSKYCAFGSGIKDCQDCNFSDTAELCYEASNMTQNFKKLFSLTSWFSKEIAYCDSCFTCSDLFGCIGLRNKNFCILNKQYSEEEYRVLVEKIKVQMNEMPYTDTKGRLYTYGEFFPLEFSPFGYNESIAQEYFPKEKSEIEAQGFAWKEREDNVYTITKKAANLPNDIKDVDESIPKEVIECEVSKRAFRLTPAEFQFYKSMGIPLPRLHPDLRHKARLAKQNPMQLWHRQCMCQNEAHGHASACPNEFETSYSPERGEVVYCEGCYQKEVI